MELSDFFWQAMITMLVITDPFCVVPVFAGLMRGSSVSVQLRTARRACAISLILLLIFAFGGDKLLDVLSISEPAFRITGGFLLLLAAIDMVVARGEALRAPNKVEAKEIEERDDVSVFPLAIPLIAGPGALTSVVVLMRQAEPLGGWYQLSLVGIIFITIAIMYVSLRLEKFLMRLLGVTGMNVLTRVGGVVLAALAMQSIIHGVISVMRSV